MWNPDRAEIGNLILGYRSLLRAAWNWGVEFPSPAHLEKHIRAIMSDYHNGQTPHLGLVGAVDEPSYPVDRDVWLPA